MCVSRTSAETLAMRLTIPQMIMMPQNKSHMIYSVLCRFACSANVAGGGACCQGGCTYTDSGKVGDEFLKPGDA